MPVFLRTRITDIGPEVAELAEGGVLILFAEGSPAELAEVAVLHAVAEEPANLAPAAGDTIRIGGFSAPLTAVGPAAWNKVREIGHVVINFNGAAEAERPGEICAAAIDTADLVAALAPGAEIVIAS